MKQMRKEKGITLIALVVTIVVLMIIASIGIVVLTEGGTIEKTNFAKYGATIREYQKALDSYIIEQDMNNDGEETIIYTTDKEEIKKIIPIITDEDLEKFIIQDNEIRYREDKVSEKEKGWLAELGVIAMVAVYALTYMNGDKVHKVVYADKIVFPLTNPTSSKGGFSGWFYEEDLQTEAHEGDVITSDITLYAKWGNVIVTYIVDGIEFAKIEGDKIKFPDIDPTSTIGNFSGWYNSDFSERAQEGETVVENTTLYAKFEDFIATFMGDNSVFQEIQGNSLTFPSSNPSKTNVKFTGWYYDQACTQVASIGDILTKNTTLYPRWNSYITNKLNGKYISMLGTGRDEYSSDWTYVTSEDELKMLPYYSWTSGAMMYMDDWYPAWAKIREFL